MAGRRWTPAEDAAIRAGYETEGVEDLAVGLSRSVPAVYQRAVKLGLTATVCHIDWTPAVAARFAELHSLGWSDAEVAADLGCIRGTVSRHRRAAGLPSNRGSAHCRGRCAERYRRQMARLGVSNSHELVAIAARQLAERYGLPSDLRPRHVQIVLALVSGPLTKRQVCEAIGLSLDVKRPVRALHSADGHWTYLGGLIARGLVKRVRLPIPGGGRGRFRGPQNVYMLTPQAMNLLTKGEDRATGKG
jgi:AraC-like DNA-binding protein